MFLYKMNKTMELLGNQKVLSLISNDGVAAEDFKNLIDAHRKNKTNSIFDIGLDAFMLGYIYGKRVERNRKKIAKK